MVKKRATVFEIGYDGRQTTDDGDGRRTPRYCIDSPRRWAKKKRKKDSFWDYKTFQAFRLHLFEYTLYFSALIWALKFGLNWLIWAHYRDFKVHSALYYCLICLKNNTVFDLKCNFSQFGSIFERNKGKFNQKRFRRVIFFWVGVILGTCPFH